MKSSEIKTGKTYLATQRTTEYDRADSAMSRAPRVTVLETGIKHEISVWPTGSFRPHRSTVKDGVRVRAENDAAKRLLGNRDSILDEKVAPQDEGLLRSRQIWMLASDADEMLARWAREKEGIDKERAKADAEADKLLDRVRAAGLTVADHRKDDRPDRDADIEVYRQNPLFVQPDVKVKRSGLEKLLDMIDDLP